MGTISRIEWTEQTWNPVTGCTKVSPGCKHCYAETMANRLQAMGAAGYENGFKVSLMPDRLEQPLQRRTPTTYFVNSMSDLFQEEVPFKYIETVLSVIRRTPQHTYQILTKRAERMEAFFSRRSVPANAWLGVSVEDRRYGLPRIPHLRSINAQVRFLSVEPLLEDLGVLDLDGIHWVIVGGESGHGARRMEPTWVANIHSACEEQGVAFFFKQWGAWSPDGLRRNKKINGREFLGRVWNGMPRIPVVES